MISFWEVDDNLLETVLKNINYSSKSALLQDVEKVKEWLQTQPHLPEIMEDAKIQNFLILNKGSVERTKEKIDNYYSIRSWMPDIFNGSNPKLPYIEKYLKMIYWIPLPKLTKNKKRVFLLKLRSKEFPEDYSYSQCHIDALRYSLNLFEIRLSEDIIEGDILVADGTDMTFSHMTSIAPSFLITAHVIFSKVLSSRVGGIFLLKPPPLTEKIIAILRKFVKPKILDRIVMCSNGEILIEHLGKKILPKDYGGDERSLEELQGIIKKKFDEYQDRFDEMDRLRVNENLRPKKLENDEMLGFYGNFKRLEID